MRPELSARENSAAGAILRPTIPRLALLALLGLGTAAEWPDSTSPSFAEFARRSETILSGTVERAWIETDRRVHAPVVRVVLEDIRTVKGRVDPPLITFWLREGDAASPRGGKAPEFRKGERYVFMIPESLDSGKAGYTPITALGGGLFPVFYDSSRRMPLVHDFSRRPVARIASDRLVVVDAMQSVSKTNTPGASPSGKAVSMAPWIEVLPAAEDPGSRVSEETFLRFVRELLTGQPPR